MSDNKNPYLARRRGQEVKKLRDKLSRYFAEKGYDVSNKYPFILDDWHSWPQNIIHPGVVEYIQKVKAEKKKDNKPFPLHKYIHHGLSSQAMLFNLLGPLVVEKNYTVFDRILQEIRTTPVGKVAQVEFEIENRDIFNENNGQPTSIDMVISTDANVNYYVEFKFTEAEFGGCTLFFNGDCDGTNPLENLDMCILQEARRKYWEVMYKQGLVTPKILSESRCPFIDLYQSYREVMFALENQGEFILMYDERNPAIYDITAAGTRGVYARFMKYLPLEIQNKCHIITNQKVYEIISSMVQETWVKEVGNKYF